jgi:hypothetical protein
MAPLRQMAPEVPMWISGRLDGPTEADEF